jgi:hypothetical protein
MPAARMLPATFYDVTTLELIALRTRSGRSTHPSRSSRLCGTIGTIRLRSTNARPASGPRAPDRVLSKGTRILAELPIRVKAYVPELTASLGCVFHAVRKDHDEGNR